MRLEIMQLCYNAVDSMDKIIERADRVHAWISQAQDVNPALISSSKKKETGKKQG